MWSKFRPCEGPEMVHDDGRAEHVPGRDLEDQLGVIENIARYALAPSFG